ncbi:dipeptidase PepV [Agrilactobacillus fermenti]|uniref:dipeptidase PepV n=1 Tax=Agrilactobacillus fermenti TaxID=2586909 RepID=UPI003A5BFCDD
MTINWQTAIQDYQDDLIRDLSELLAINSERDIEHKTSDFPLGPGPAKALQKMLAFAERDGFATKNINNVAGRIEFGSGDQILGVLGHVDVVPAGEGWQTDPFTPVIQDGKIIARGTSDDKGPVMAAYYALKLLKDQGFEPKQSIHFILGTDEESEWVGLHEYLEQEPTPDWGFSPDAEFPIINGEKGIVSFVLTQNLTHAEAGTYTLLTFKSGIRDNMVPHSAQARVQHDFDPDFEAAFDQYLSTNHLTGSITHTGGYYDLLLQGQGAHAANPQEGRNGATFLASFLNQWAFDASGQQYLKVIANDLHEDIYGQNIAIAYRDDLMGPLTVSASIFNYDRANSQASILLNVRYPQGTTVEQMTQQLSNHFGAQFNIATKGHFEVPHYVPGSDPLVKTLLKTYEDHTGQPGEEIIVGGGTYGRILKRGVAFGAQFPGRKDLMHQPNELMYIEDILKASAIYADAIYRLTQTAE